MPILRTEARRLYQCDCCGKTDVWSDSWRWYGSYKQLDDEGMKGVKPIMTICSADCTVILIAQDKLPHEGIDDAGNVVEEAKPGALFRKRRTPQHSSQHQNIEAG